MQVALELGEIVLNGQDHQIEIHTWTSTPASRDALGFPTAMVTVLFALAHTVGWVAQWNEMIVILPDGTRIRALAGFVRRTQSANIEWSGQIRSIPFKNTGPVVVPFRDKPEMDALLAGPRSTHRARSDAALLLFLYSSARAQRQHS